MKKERYDVTGMTCASCVRHVEDAVKKQPGTKNVVVNLLTNSMVVEYDEQKLNPALIEKAVDQAGYGASLHQDEINTPAANKKTVSLAQQSYQQTKKRLFLSLIIAVFLLYLAMGKMLHLPLPLFFTGQKNLLIWALTQMLLALILIVINKNYFISGFKSLFHLAPNMDALVAIGAGTAFLYSLFSLYRLAFGFGHQQASLISQYGGNLYFDSTGMILTLITLGKTLEAKAKGQTTTALDKLLDLAPKTARILKGNQEITVPLAELKQGDLMLVKTGESLPADGIVMSGTASLDESSLTGESLPLTKHQGDSVFSATIVKSGYLTVKATRVGQETTLSQIIKLVDDANSSKAPIASLADKISAIFVPAVIGLALLTFIVWLILGASFSFALSSAISVLVISCPCALGLATPTAIMVGTGKGASLGILFKSAESLQKTHEVQSIILDKTGTITKGQPQVTDVLVSSPDLLTIAFSLEKLSEHPLAKALTAFAQKQKVTPKPVTEFNQLTGLGLSGKINGRLYFSGNQKLMQQQQITIPAEIDIDQFSQAGKTPLFFASEQSFLGVICVADVIKEDSPKAISQFKSLGIEPIMLTGDNQKTAQAIAQKVGITNVMADVLPQDKANMVKKLQAQGKKVAMVGDGINDAPALAQADVGIAIGAGTDVAIDSSDLVLMHSRLSDVTTALELSRATIKNIKENLFWAFFYNVIGIPVAAGLLYPTLGLKLSPMLGALAMSFSSVFVVFNALRLRFFKPSLRTASVEKTMDSADADVIIKNIKSPTIKGDNLMKKTFSVEGMSCDNCVKHVTNALLSVDGVKDAVVSLQDNKAQVEMEASVSKDALQKAVADAGYTLK